MLVASGTIVREGESGEAGGPGMKLSGRKVIKSDEVKFFKAPGDRTLSADGVDPERIRDAFARKIRITEQEFYEKGLSDGIRKGRDLEKGESRKTLQAMSVIVKEMSGLKKSTLESMEEEIVQLSLAIAEKVIHLEVATNREVIRGVLREAIKNIGDRENMKIRVHPQDFRFMMEIKNDFLQSFDGIRNVIFAEDESIQRGGAIIETVCGEVDARLDQQFHEIKAAMTAVSE
jgi:flagellar assembly protein FliH